MPAKSLCLAGCPSAVRLGNLLTGEPGKQGVWSQKRDMRKLDPWGPKCHRNSRFWVSSPDSALQVEEVGLFQDFPTQVLPHSFETNFNSQDHYSPSTPLIWQDWFCRMGIREHLARSSSREQPTAEELQQPLPSSTVVLAENIYV